MSADLQDDENSAGSGAGRSPAVRFQQERLTNTIEAASADSPLEAPDTGDFHEAFVVPDGTGDIALLIGDVTGHGAAAARRADIIRGEAVAHLTAGEAPLSVVSAANDAVQFNDDRFATLFVGRLDAKTGELRYASAGHEPGLLAHEATSEIEELETTGPPIGVLPTSDETFEERNTLLPEGSTLVLTTDGVSEARAKQTGNVDFYGRDRLKAAVARRKGLPLVSFVSQLVDLLLAFTRRHFTDDLAIMAIRRNKQGPK